MINILILHNSNLSKKLDKIHKKIFKTENCPSSMNTSDFSICYAHSYCSNQQPILILSSMKMMSSVIEYILEKYEHLKQNLGTMNKSLKELNNLLAILKECIVVSEDKLPVSACRSIQLYTDEVNEKALHANMTIFDYYLENIKPLNSYSSYAAINKHKEAFYRSVLLEKYEFKRNKEFRYQGGIKHFPELDYISNSYAKLPDLPQPNHSNTYTAEKKSVAPTP